MNSSLLFFERSFQLSIIMLLFLTVGCAPNIQTNTNKKRLDNKLISQNVVEEVFNRKHIAAVDRLFTEDYVYHHPLLGQTQGREAIKAQVIDAHKALADFHIDIHEILSENNLAVIRFTASGKHVASFMELPATGKKLRITGIILSKIENGMIAEDWEFADLIGVRQQLDTKNPIPSGSIPERTAPDEFSWGQIFSKTTYPANLESNKALIGKLAADLSTPKTSAHVSGLFSRKFRFHVPNLPDLKSFEDLERYWRKIDQTALNLVVSMDDLAAERDMAAVKWSCRFIHSATGKQAQTGGIAIFKIANGKIVEGWLSNDMLGLLQQIGLLANQSR